ncbi:hypothetical protein C8J56DRAFT_964878 [Mycena floridula]|nr:hypothetical protein C8J56DRAFT_964878 [Mycena floridula]
MLSAVAARKAAQASKPPLSPEPIFVDISSPSPSPPPKPASKRKPSEQSSAPRKKKKKTHKPPRNARYFDEQVSFAAQEDVLIVPLSDSEDEAALLEEEIPSQSEPSSPRAEEEAGPSAPSRVEPQRISTFEPVLNQNLFHVTTEELRTFHLNPSSNSSAALICLAQGETIGLLGVYHLAVLHGSITVAGTELGASRRMHRVFAPKSAPLPVLEAHRSDSVPSDAIPSRFISLLQPQNIVILVQELSCHVERLGLVCRPFDGVFEPPARSTAGLDLTGVHIITQNSKNIQPFLVLPSWKEALLSIDPSSSKGVYLVKGPKKSGKSGFSRTLVNNLLKHYQKVAYLECDLGQSEFTPCAMVALNIVEAPVFGPPFTHPTLPAVAHYIGATTPQSSPSHYLAAIQAVLQFYRLDVQTPVDDSLDEEDIRMSSTIPLVVNTMGWTKGLGVDLARKIEEMVEPSQVFEFDSPKFDNGWLAPAPSMEYQTSIPTQILEPIPPSVLSTAYNAAEHRHIAIMSYLHAVFPSSIAAELREETVQNWDIGLPLCARPPYEVEFATAIDKVILSGAGYEDVEASEIDRVLNGALVGLVSCDPGTLDDDVKTNGIPYSQGTSVPSPLTSVCHGLALIRSVAPDASRMHLLSPLPPSILTKSRVLIKGEVELPVWGMLDFGTDRGVAGVEKNKVPFLQWGKGSGIGGDKRRVRRNLMRKGQM